MSWNQMILCVLLAMPLIAEEEPDVPPPDLSVAESAVVQNLDLTLPVPSACEFKETFAYLSFSPAPGAGISRRIREDGKGTALDVKVGFLAIHYRMPVVSVDYNWLKYSRKHSKRSPYVSYGIGAYYLVPYIPIRTGIEFQHGFIDIGAKMILGILPVPEIRGGIDF